MLKIKDIDWNKYMIEEWETCYVSYVKQKSQEWFDLRKGRITGSNIGKIVGHNPFNKVDDYTLSLYIKGEKKEYFDEESLYRMNKGVEYEPIAREKFKSVFFNKDHLNLNGNSEDLNYEEKEIGICIWKKDERFASSPDGFYEYKELNPNRNKNDDQPIYIKKRIGLEIKCPKYLYKCLDENKIFDSYYDQMLLCYKILNLDKIYYFVYSYENKDYHLQEAEINEEWWDAIYQRSKNFYDKYL